MINIFNIRIDDLNLTEVMAKISQFLIGSKQCQIVLPYSEFIVRAQKDKEFRQILNEADLSLCESRGLYLMIRAAGYGLRDNIYGLDLVEGIVTQFNSVFLVGGRSQTVAQLKNKFGGKVLAIENGYQDLNELVGKINKVKPKILLVGLGSPKQEKWIKQNLSKMPSVKVAIGVGGAFDFLSGQIKRAPKLWRSFGLEWLWRLFRQPRRLGRIIIGVGGLLLLVIHTRFVKK